MSCSLLTHSMAQFKQEPLTLDMWPISPPNQPDRVSFPLDTDPPSPSKDVLTLQPCSKTSVFCVPPSTFDSFIVPEQFSLSSSESEPTSPYDELSPLPSFCSLQRTGMTYGAPTTSTSDLVMFKSEPDIEFLSTLDCDSGQRDFSSRNPEHTLDSSSDSEPSSPFSEMTCTQFRPINNNLTQRLACDSHNDGDGWVRTNTGLQILVKNEREMEVNIRGHVYDIETTVPIIDDSSKTDPRVTTDNNNNSTLTSNNSNMIIKPGSETHFLGPTVGRQRGSCQACNESRQGYSGNGRANNRYVDLNRCDDDDLEDMHKGRSRRQVARTERLWEFILRLLGDPKHNPRLIEWVDRSDGTFRLNNSKAIALMWGMRKNNTQMTYEKLSRALRYYYHRKILEPVLGKKLVYRFGPNASPVWETCPYRSQGAR